MKSRTLLFAGCLSFLFFCAQAQQRDYSFKETMKATSLPFEVNLSSSDGDIELLSGDGNSVEILYIVKKSGRVLEISRQELEKEFIVEQSQTDNALRIAVKNRTLNRFRFSDNISVNFRITVPQSTSSTLTTSDGNVMVRGTKGSVNITTSDGNIKLEDIQGSVESRTSDGNIFLSRVKGNISVTSSDGDISFNDVSGSFQGVTSDGNIRGNLLEVKELTAKTGDGNIDVTLPDHLGLDLNIRGENVQVPLNNFSGSSSDSSIKGKSNGGGIAITLTTSDGNVKVKYL